MRVAGSINFGFRRTTGEATFKFLSELFGVSILTLGKSSLKIRMCA
jgi:hypothetical protein